MNGKETDMALKMEIRATTREMFEGMSEDERILLESSISMSLAYWKDELNRVFSDCVLHQIESGKGTDSKAFRSAWTELDNMAECYSHYVILDKEWNYLLHGKSE